MVAARLVSKPWPWFGLCAPGPTGIQLSSEVEMKAGNIEVHNWQGLLCPLQVCTTVCSNICVGDKYAMYITTSQSCGSSVTGSRDRHCRSDKLHASSCPRLCSFTPINCYGEAAVASMCLLRGIFSPMLYAYANAAPASSLTGSADD